MGHVSCMTTPMTTALWKSMFCILFFLFNFSLWRWFPFFEYFLTFASTLHWAKLFPCFWGIKTTHMVVYCVLNFYLSVNFISMFFGFSVFTMKPPGIKWVTHDIIKSAEDQRNYRGLELENGLKVLLISDPTTDMSSAAMDVHVGKQTS